MTTKVLKRKRKRNYYGLGAIGPPIVAEDKHGDAKQGYEEEVDV